MEMGQIMKAKRKILVIEGETSLAMRMVYLLTCAGYGVEAVSNGQKAMALAEKNRFDLITLGVTDSASDGSELSENLLHALSRKEVPVIFVTDRVTPADRRHAIAAGAADLIVKPFGASDFLSRISACLKSQPHNASRLTRAGELIEKQRD
jgi:DNA-binding response OmpR family regulator